MKACLHENRQSTGNLKTCNLCGKVVFSPAEVRELETKMLPRSTGRDKNESPKISLSREEQLVYANYLEVIGQPAAAAFFRK